MRLSNTNIAESPTSTIHKRSLHKRSKCMFSVLVWFFSRTLDRKGRALGLRFDGSFGSRLVFFCFIKKSTVVFLKCLGTEPVTSHEFVIAESLVVNSLLYDVVCWGSIMRAVDTNRLTKLIYKASNSVGVELDSLMAVSERRMQITENIGQSSTFSPWWAGHSGKDSFHHGTPQ